MEIEFSQFEQNEYWVTGIANDGKYDYNFEAKLFDEVSNDGINGGRVSKLRILSGTCIVNYDRGWDIKPDHDEDVEAYVEILDFLENAPKTRFSQ